jgi:altronate dehydratase large subunit
LSGETDMPDSKLLRLHEDDNVGVALADLPVGATVAFDKGPPLALRDAVPFGHKVALATIASGEPVVKYGEPIGLATQSIAPGEHVHTHNLVSARAQPHASDLTVPRPSKFPTSPPPNFPIYQSTNLPTYQPTNLSFQAYLRPDGRAGIRNHLLVLPSVFCANVAAERIAEAVPGAVALSHPYGCAQLDADRVADTLASIGAHPNVGATLVIGLGCEVVQADALANRIAATGQTVEVLSIQREGGTLKTIASGRELAQKLAAHLAAQRRRMVSLSKLVLATECGGSDATSGLAANPVVGVVADRVAAVGGTVILSETAELMGAEHILARRAANAGVGRQIVEMVSAVERETLRLGVDLRAAQPSPGNVAGGLTTIEEKSLGCIYKAGSSAVQGVLAYAEPPPGPGLYVMDTPGHDGESVTGMVAGGAQIVIFSTGRGTPLGAPVAPVIKLTANPRTARSMADHIDFSAAGVITGETTVEKAGEALWAFLLRTLEGQETATEILGHREFAITRAGPSV